MISGQVEIVRADPVLRRRVLLAALAVVAIGAAAIHAAPGALHEIFRVARESPAEAEARARLLMAALLGPMVVGSLATGIGVVRTSVRALRTLRFPPPGARVLRDTPVIRGRGARVVGGVALFLGATLVCASLALAWYGYRAAEVLRQGCPRAARAAAADRPVRWGRSQG